MMKLRDARSWAAILFFSGTFFDSMQEPAYVDHPRLARKPNRRTRNCELVGQSSEQIAQTETARLARAVKFCFTVFSVR
jgi:hypothetical protein